MDIHYIAILAATIVQFVIGAIWYTPLFGKLWGKMHGFDQLTAEVQAVAMKRMIPLLFVQFIVTFLTTFVFTVFISGLPQNWNIYGIAGFIWLGFVLPTQVIPDQAFEPVQAVNHDRLKTVLVRHQTIQRRHDIVERCRQRKLVAGDL